MADDKQNPLMIVVLVLLIAAAGFFIMRRVKSGSEQPVSQVYWVCDDCNEGLAAPKEAINLSCPKCNGKHMLIAMKYECPKCKTVFEAYRMEPSAGMMPRVKVKGGPFQPMQVALQRDPRISNPKCPNCNAEKTRDWQTLYPPPAKYSDVKHLLPDPEAVLRQFDEQAPAPVEEPR